MKHRLIPLTFAIITLMGMGTQTRAANTLQPNANGTVYDTSTSLMWKRCMEGQTWDGITCVGTANPYAFDQATALNGNTTFAGYHDWRLPNIRELLTLVDYSVLNPALNSVAFPNAPVSSVWSDSPNGYDVTMRWIVSLADGNSFMSYSPPYNTLRSYSDPNVFINYTQNVLLVRGASSPLLTLARPNSDYVDNGDGTVTHTPTQLMWQRCTVGQSWNGTICTGNTTAMTWAEAIATTSNFAGKNDWRIPSQQELLSLVDYTPQRVMQKMNTDIFPTAWGSVVWSATPYVGSSLIAWEVYFGSGDTKNNDRSTGSGVMFVRNADTSIVPTTDTECFFNWAEGVVPSLLTPHLMTQTTQGIGYRGSYSSGIYLGIQGDLVLAVGGKMGNSITTLGTLSEFIPTARAAGCK